MAGHHAAGRDVGARTTAPPAPSAPRRFLDGMGERLGELRRRMAPSPGDHRKPLKKLGDAVRRWRWPRRVARRYHRVKPGGYLAVALLVVVAGVVLDFIAGPHGFLDRAQHDRAVAVGLLENAVVTALAAAFAYYLLRGFKAGRALRGYRREARDNPEELVDWARGDARLVRPRVCRALAERIARAGQAEVVVMRGRGGTGTTNYVVGLVSELARKKFLPVAVVMEPGPAPDLLALAQTRFCTHVSRQPVLGSESEADAIWRRARSTDDLVILVDGLDPDMAAFLSLDGGKRFRQALASLVKQRIRVVLATSGDLPLGRDEDWPGKRRPVAREDLDLLGRREAEQSLGAVLGDNKAVAARGLAALHRLRDPVDGFELSPFYLDLIVRLAPDVEAPLEELPQQRDAWRHAVLEAYVTAVRRGRVGTAAFDRLGSSATQRGKAAVNAATRVAKRVLTGGSDSGSVGRKPLRLSDRQLADAFDLNLLWHSDERVGLSSDDLGAYLLGSSTGDAAPLTKAMQAIAGRKRYVSRHDRYVMSAFVEWHASHEVADPLDELRFLLTGPGPNPRPAAVAMAARVAALSGISDPDGEIAAAAESSVAWAKHVMKGNDRERTGELVRLVRALAEWPDPSVHEVLWELATARQIEVEWPAAKALALTESGPAGAVRESFETKLKAAEDECEAGHGHELSGRSNDLGNAVGSLAWVLPSLRDDPDVDAQFKRVLALCRRDDMSPLRFEMSLAQGLKFALINKRAAEANFATVDDLLCGEPPLRFWHARLIVAQAALAHGWQSGAADGLDGSLKSCVEKEKHPLAKAGMKLARDGVKKIPSAQPDGDGAWLGDYIWVHERDGVRWVEQGRRAVGQLVADTVLVSNMIYRLRRDDAGVADEVAERAELPDCIRRSPDRKVIDSEACHCGHELCRAVEEDREHAVREKRARFSETFCREQANLVALEGPPSWTGGRAVRKRQLRKDLEEFWKRQAARADDG